jgi:hypothetical protein
MFEQKVDKKKKQVAGYALVANEGDWHQDIVYEEELEKAAWSFLRNMAHHWQWGTGTGEQHYKYTGVGWPIESAIDRNGSIGRMHGVKAKPGSWWIRVQIVDDNVWSGIENGDITGFSIAGMARRVELNPEDGETEEAKRVKSAGLVEFVKRAKRAGIENVVELLSSLLDDESIEQLEDIEQKVQDSGESDKSSTEGGTDVDENKVREIVQAQLTEFGARLEEKLAISVADAVKAAGVKPETKSSGGDEGEKTKTRDDQVIAALTELSTKVDGIKTDVDAIKRAPASGRAGKPADTLQGVSLSEDGKVIVPLRRDGSNRPDYGSMMGKGAFDLRSSPTATIAAGEGGDDNPEFEDPSEDGAE